MDELADRIVQFLSTLPARGATDGGFLPFICCLISIHAPREGSDPIQRDLRPAAGHFYPRSPRGERLVVS